MKMIWKPMIKGFGTTGSMVVRTVDANLKRRDVGIEKEPSILVFDSDKSGNMKHSPLRSSLMDGDGIPMIFISMPEKDLGEHLANRRMPHLNYVDHGFLDRKESSSGMGHLPGLTSLACAYNRESYKQILKEEIKRLKSATKGENAAINIFSVCSSCGGTGPVVSHQMMEICREIQNEVGGGIEDIEWNSFVLLPNFNTKSQLSFRHLANTYGFLKQIAAFQNNCLRYGRVTIEGQYDPTHESLNPNTFALSDIGKGSILNLPLLNATAARSIEWLGTTPLGAAFRSSLVNFHSEVQDIKVPTVIRTGAAHISIPCPEGIEYMKSQLKMEVLKKSLQPHREAYKAARDILAKEKLLEDRGSSLLSKELGKQGKFDMHEILIGPAERFNPGSKKAVDRADEAKDFIALRGKDGLKKVAAQIEINKKMMLDGMESRVERLTNKLLKENGLGEALSVGRTILAIIKTSTGEISRKLGNDTKRRGELKKEAENLYGVIKKYPSWPWLKKLLHWFGLKRSVGRYQSLCVDALRLAYSVEVNTAALKVIGGFHNALGKEMEELERLEKHVRELLEGEESQIKHYLRSGYTYLGLGQVLFGGGSFKKRFGLKDISPNLLKSLLEGFAFELAGAHSTGKLTLLKGYLDGAVERALTEEISRIKSMDVSELIRKDPDREKILAKMVAQSALLTPADEVRGKGKKFNLVGIDGSESNPLRGEIKRIAGLMEIEGAIEFVDTGNSTEIVLLRFEVGRHLDSLKILKVCEEAYHKMGDGRFTCHMEPLWGLLPPITDPENTDDGHKYLLYGLVSGAISEDGDGDLVHKLLSGEFISAGSDGTGNGFEEWAKNYAAKVDAVSRYIHLIKKEGFAEMAKRTGQVKKKHKKAGWVSVAGEVMDELKTLARIYHQSI